VFLILLYFVWEAHYVSAIRSEEGSGKTITVEPNYFNKLNRWAIINSIKKKNINKAQKYK
jgi:hypothetical protein